MRKEEDPERPMVVLSQLLGLAHGGLPLTALPGFKPIEFHTQTLRNDFRRVAALLPRSHEERRVHFGWDGDRHRDSLPFDVFAIES